MNNKHPDFDYFKERDDISEEEERIIEAANIPDDEKVRLRKSFERCSRVFEDDYWADRDLPPLFTEARKEEQKCREINKFQTYFYCLRDVVFSIEDIDLRRKLIRNERRFRALKVKSSQHDLWEAEQDLRKIQRDSGPILQWLLIAVFFLAGGWHEWGFVGAIGGAVLSIIYTLYAIRDFDHKKGLRITEATSLVSDRLAEVNLAVSQQIFSIREEDFGEPDL